MKTPIAMLFALLALAGHAQAEQQLYSTEQVEQSIDIALDLINPKLPVMIDEHTRLDRVTKDAPNKTTHHFTIVAAPAAELRDPEAKDFMTNWTVKRMCETPDVRKLLDSGLISEQAFRGNDGQPVFTFTVSRASCGSA